MKRTPVKKVVLGFAIAALVAAVLTMGLAIWAVGALGSAHMATPSLIATTVFFACCGIVLYFMSVMPRTLPPDEQP
jgi:hypothetical protein